MKLRERDLEFDFTDALDAVKFDDGTVHSSSSIQPVDFIVEFEDCYKFVEVKDPDEPGTVNVEAFRKKLQSGKLIRSLAGKYRDSLFFRSFQDNPRKDVEYIVLLSMRRLDDALLLAKQDQLLRSIPFTHESWKRNSASVCVILNMKQWKRKYGENSINRLSEAS